jgi:hypothetical protein
LKRNPWQLVEQKTNYFNRFGFSVLNFYSYPQSNQLDLFEKNVAKGSPPHTHTLSAPAFSTQSLSSLTFVSLRSGVVLNLKKTGNLVNFFPGFQGGSDLNEGRLMWKE